MPLSPYPVAGLVAESVVGVECFGLRGFFQRWLSPRCSASQEALVFNAIKLARIALCQSYIGHGVYWGLVSVIMSS